MGVLPISRTIWDAFSIVLVDVDVPRMISTSFVSWAGLKKCMPTVLSLTEIFWEILSRLNVDVFDAIIAVAGATAIIASNTDRKSTRLNSSHVRISYAVFCLKKKKKL